MKLWLSPRWLIIKLSGLLFAAYSAYNIYVIVRGGSELSLMGIVISAIVAFAFALLFFFAWTAGAATQKKPRFLIFRRNSFIFALLVILLLKIRIIKEVLIFLDYSVFYTILYFIAYASTVAALTILIAYFTFVVKDLPAYPRASFALPLCALILFTVGLAVEAVLYFVFNIGLEMTVLRTLVSRPLFYLGFITLCVHFMIQPKIPDEVFIYRSRKSV